MLLGSLLASVFCLMDFPGALHFHLLQGVCVGTCFHCFFFLSFFFLYFGLVKSCKNKDNHQLLKDKEKV